MPTDQDNIEETTTDILTKFAALSSTTDGGKPTYNIDGQFVDHSGHLRAYIALLEAMNKQVSTKPFTVRVRGVS